MSLKMLLGRLVWGGDAERFHTHKTIRTETVHHHTALVAHLVTLLTPKEWSVGVKYLLLRAALEHDLAEGSNNGGGVCAAGDIPSPTKRAVPEMKQAADAYEAKLLRDDGIIPIELTAPEYAVLKLADNMAGLIFCIQERWLGNKLSRYAYNVYTGYLDVAEMDGAQRAIYNELQDWWADACR